MTDRFHLQGRLIERHGPVVVRDEARRVDTDSRDEASRMAAALVGEGFTVWVWAVGARAAPGAWELVERLDPPRCPADQRAGGVRRGPATRGAPEPAGCPPGSAPGHSHRRARGPTPSAG